MTAKPCWSRFPQRTELAPIEQVTQSQTTDTRWPLATAALKASEREAFDATPRVAEEEGVGDDHAQPRFQ